MTDPKPPVGQQAKKSMTAKLAKATVRESYPKSACRYGWVTRNGVKEEHYEIFRDLRVSGNFVGNHYYGPVILGKGKTASEAWKAAAQKLIDLVEVAHVG